jgi:hypothetical protein
MIKLWNKFYDSRVGKYITFISIYYFFWKLAGFEFSVIIAVGTILGEIHYLNKDKK